MKLELNISIDYHFEKFIEQKILEGRFKNVNEVICAGLKLLEAEENKVINLRNSIQEGIMSGIANNFDAKKNLELIKAKRG